MSKGEKLYQWSEKKIQSEITTDTNKILDQDPMQQFINEQDESMMNDDAPILQDKRVNVSKNMPKKLPFRNRAQMLLNNEYTYQSGKTQKKSTKKTKNKGSMRNLVNSLMTLDNLLNETVNLENWDQLRNAFLTVCRDCETYISKHNPWSAAEKAR